MRVQPCLDRLRRPWAVWLALLLVVFGALAPTLSHAWSAARGDAGFAVAVCTSSGPRWLTQADASSPATPDPGAPERAGLTAHCPFCLLSAERLAAPPPAAQAYLLPPGTAPVPVAPVALPGLTRWVAAAQPRGPPAL